MAFFFFLTLSNSPDSTPTWEPYTESRTGNPEASRATFLILPRDWILSTYTHKRWRVFTPWGHSAVIYFPTNLRQFVYFSHSLSHSPKGSLNSPISFQVDNWSHPRGLQPTLLRLNPLYLLGPHPEYHTIHEQWCALYRNAVGLHFFATQSMSPHVNVLHIFE